MLDVRAAGRRPWWAALGLAVGLACVAGERGDAAIDPSPAVVTVAPVVAPQPVEPEPASKAAELELTFVGDLVLGRYLADERYLPMHPAGSDPFAQVREQLAADLVVGNLESPVMFELPKRSPSRRAKNRFAGSAVEVEQLADAGFSVVSLANNHFFDLGVTGQREAPQVLAAAGIVAVGASREREDGPAIRVETVETQGWRIGFVAFTTRFGDRGEPEGPRVPLLSLPEVDEALLPAVRAARADHDLVIVTVHWGVEYADEADATRRLLAHHLLAAGVDLVIGHHPHVLQAIERHPSGRSEGGESARDGLIAYSLGNFLFHRGDHPSGLSGVLRVRYQAQNGSRPCLAEARLHPVTLVRRTHWTPEAASEGPAAKVRDRVVSLSGATRTRWQREGERGDPDRGEDLVLTGLRECPSADPRSL